jgi:methylenetetrahydrofolate reductase (NADPH)
MHLRELYKNKKNVFSFEVFPPKKDYELSSLYETIVELKKLKPDFVSVTYGAGGGTREKTIEIASFIKNKLNIESLAHFTCVNSTKEEIKSVLDLLSKNKINNILALRGDPPAGENRFRQTIGGFNNASELVQFIKESNDWSIFVAGYPEGHPDSKSLDEDIRYLKLKVDKGADVIITQLFLNNDHFYRFRDKAVEVGINIPIIPGIFPILNFKSIQKMTTLSNATIPENLYKKLEKVQNSQDDTEKIGIEYAIGQSLDLLKNDVQGLHFYTMNKSKQIEKIINEINKNR